MDELQASGNTVRRGIDMAEKAGLLIVEREPGCRLQVTVNKSRASSSNSVHKPLYGPIPWRLWSRASKLPGKALHAYAICWLVCGWGRSAEFKLVASGWVGFGQSQDAISRGLDELEEAGLIYTVRGQGKTPVVTLISPG
jgi:hypothetical protein